MAVSGFEGFEKRLELHFSGDDPVFNMGLRQLPFDSLEQILHEVQCSVVSAVGNHYFDAYVLSESSLFVYPTKIIIKTCGTTQLLKSIPPLLHHALNLGLTISSCRYTRGNFIFPLSQPFPHTSFHEEVVYLEDSLPNHLCYRKASVMPSNVTAHVWHVFSACDQTPLVHFPPSDLYTVEICMTELDRTQARKFFRRPGDGKTGDAAGKEMTEIAGIHKINPNALICDFAFDPCGYSMNGIDGDRYSTIHVTPEDGYSYASFECVGSIYDDEDDEDGGDGDDFIRMLRRAVQVFRPGKVSVSVTTATTASHRLWARVAGAMEPLGLKCRSCMADEFPAAGSVVFQTFTARRKKTGECGGGGR
ncbi:S-adenosylmethionine decarboxylase proenzyme 4, partial [Cucurbita argyrosperma subsp. argyrosperma]